MDRVNKDCLYCGTSLVGMRQSHRRKYCSRTCGNKYNLRQKKPGVQEKLWQHDPEVFQSAMEMYWSGISSAAIAGHFAIPVGTMYSWVHDFGSQRERAIMPVSPFDEKLIQSSSLKESFRLAHNADEWREILNNSESQNEEAQENANITLVCGKLHGQSANKLASVVYEKLKDDPLNGKTYAFCNKCGNAITTISWSEPIYHIARYVKTSGTFIWPDEKLGKSIEVKRAGFDHLISMQKYRNNGKNT